MQAIEALVQAQAEEAVRDASLSQSTPATAGNPVSHSDPVAFESQPPPSTAGVRTSLQGDSSQAGGPESRGDSSEGEEHDKREGWSLVTSVKDKLPSRRRPCVCGSGKRYKNCCGVPKGAAARRRKAEQEKTENGHTGVAVPMSNLYI